MFVDEKLIQRSVVFVGSVCRSMGVLAGTRTNHARLHVKIKSVLRLGLTQFENFLLKSPTKCHWLECQLVRFTRQANLS